jgi:hypothetical protein
LRSHVEGLETLMCMHKRMWVCLQILYRIVVFTALVQRVVSSWLLSKLASSYGVSDFFLRNVEFDCQLGNLLT